MVVQGNNKLVMEFMGDTEESLTGRHDYFIGDDDPEELWDFLRKETAYDSDWNLLMKVVDKISHMDLGKYREDMYSYLFTINRLHVYIERFDQTGQMPMIQPIIGREATDMKDATYKAVVEFIEWHNLEKSE